MNLGMRITEIEQHRQISKGTIKIEEKLLPFVWVACGVLRGGDLGGCGDAVVGDEDSQGLSRSGSNLDELLEPPVLDVEERCSNPVRSSSTWERWMPRETGGGSAGMGCRRRARFCLGKTEFGEVAKKSRRLPDLGGGPLWRVSPELPTPGDASLQLCQRRRGNARDGLWAEGSNSLSPSSARRGVARLPSPGTPEEIGAATVSCEGTRGSSDLLLSAEGAPEGGRLREDAAAGPLVEGRRRREVIPPRECRRGVSSPLLSLGCRWC
ncbi:hypothetical protein MLD38_027759 [Melastoma candidum]|uniref:Uncharacterized protein n=1 Tax=Melastoma candidum TaxID=119954 RepID=A0ACB9P750_9MYRT|nr:hypothetical protein MLD38_027759 [Melastoma candidum]